MHLQIIVRGVINQVRLWESIMQGHYFKWRRINLKTKKEEIVLVQGGLRPSVLGTYEYIFPKEALPDVLNILGLTDKNRISAKPSFKNKARLAFLRKICGVKKIPESAFKKAKELPDSIYFEDSERGLSHTRIPSISIHPIGIKEDDTINMYDPEKKKEFEQEGL